MPKNIKIPTLPISTTFAYKGKTYKVIGDCNTSCTGCAFYHEGCTMINTSEKVTRGYCNAIDRKDNKNILYKEITKEESMNEIKTEIKIDIPEGYVIDTINSNLTEGIIKFKKKYLTLDDIPLTNCRLVIQACGISMTKIKAIAILMDIANYYNDDWEAFEDKNLPNYTIIFNTVNNHYDIDIFYTNKNSGVYFKNQEDAQAVIDNPNFRDILDTIYKN